MRVHYTKNTMFLLNFECYSIVGTWGSNEYYKLHSSCIGGLLIFERENCS